MDTLTDRLSLTLRQHTMQVRRMLACKGAMDIAEAQALCSDIETLIVSLRSLQRRVVHCAAEHVQTV